MCENVVQVICLRNGVKLYLNKKITYVANAYYNVASTESRYYANPSFATPCSINLFMHTKM
jgi:hypothetical protein